MNIDEVEARLAAAEAAQARVELDDAELDRLSRAITTSLASDPSGGTAQRLAREALKHIPAAPAPAAASSIAAPSVQRSDVELVGARTAGEVADDKLRRAQ